MKELTSDSAATRQYSLICWLYSSCVIKYPLDTVVIFSSASLCQCVYVLGAFLISYDCQSGARYPYPLLITRYALLGLHRYNILQGTNFRLAALEKFNKTMTLTSSYYLTFLADDPKTSPLRFQVRVDERAYTTLDLTVAIARPKNEAAVTTTEPFVPHFHGSAVSDGVFQGKLPVWPSDDALNDDRNRFYVLKESEWQTTGWISLYLELLICTSDRQMFDIDLSKVQILKVAIETDQEEDQKPPNERLNARRAHVYITFKGLAESPPLADEIGVDIERKAIIRRVVDENSGYLTLKGSFWSDKDTEHRSKRLRSVETAESSQKRSRLGFPECVTFDVFQ